MPHVELKASCIQRINDFPDNCRQWEEPFLHPAVHVAHIPSLDIICTDKRQAEKAVEDIKEALAPILKRHTSRLRRQISKEL